jgi:hypothetical protein
MKKLSVIFVMLFALAVAVNAQDAAALKDGTTREMDGKSFYYVFDGKDTNGKDIAFWIMEEAMFSSVYNGSEEKPGWIAEHKKTGAGEDLLTISYRVPNDKGREWFLARTKVLMPVILNWDKDIQPKLQDEKNDWKDVRRGLKDIRRIIEKLEESGWATAVLSDTLEQLGVDSIKNYNLSYSAVEFVVLTDWAEKNKNSEAEEGGGGGKIYAGYSLENYVWSNIKEKDKKVEKLLHLESGSQHLVNATALRSDWLFAVSETRKKKTPEEWKDKYAEYEKNINDYAVDKTDYVEAYKNKSELAIPEALKEKDDFFRYAAEVK